MLTHFFMIKGAATMRARPTVTESVTQLHPHQRDPLYTTINAAIIGIYYSFCSISHKGVAAQLH